MKMLKKNMETSIKIQEITAAIEPNTTVKEIYDLVTQVIVSSSHLNNSCMTEIENLKISENA